MSINDEQFEQGALSYETFKIAAGEQAAKYLTYAVIDDNMEKIVAFSRDNIPGGLANASQIGFFEIGFRACLKAGTLTADPNWRSRAEKLAAGVGVTLAEEGRIHRAALAKR